MRQIEQIFTDIFQTHRHIKHIVLDVFFSKIYVVYVSMCLKKYHTIIYVLLNLYFLRLIAYF